MIFDFNYVSYWIFSSQTHDEHFCLSTFRPSSPSMSIQCLLFNMDAFQELYDIPASCDRHKNGIVRLTYMLRTWANFRKTVNSEMEMIIIQVWALSLNLNLSFVTRPTQAEYVNLPRAYLPFATTLLHAPLALCGSLLQCHQPIDTRTSFQSSSET
jgi:hypothetical protein